MFNIECNYQTKINKENEFIARVKTNQKVCIKTINAYGDKFKDLNELMTLINCKDGKTHHHPLTGPIYINEAIPGDVLKVHIYKIEVKEMAQSLSKTAGIEPLTNPGIAERIPVISQKCSEREISYTNGINLPYKPMIGMIAVSSAIENIKTGHAQKRNGGNLDIPFVTEETDIYLPVDIEGAGLYLGDVHGLQGYGELSGIAMEASSKVIIDVEVLKPRKKLDNIIIIGKEPFSKKECIGIVGIGSKMNLEEAILDAFQGSYNLLQQCIPTMSQNMVKSLITLIGNSFNGQAFSKTSESTNIIVISKDDLQKITKNKYEKLSKEIEKILFEEKNNRKENKK